MSRNTTVVLMLALMVVGIAVLGWVLTRPPAGDGGGSDVTPTVDDGAVGTPGALRAGKPGAVTGEVRILATQAPAPAIEVEITGAGKPIYVETNSLGKFIAAAPSGVDLTVRVVAPEPYATLQLKGINLEPDKSTSLGTLYLERAFLVKGEVVDHQGRQVAGAEVAAYRPTMMDANLNLIDIITSVGKQRTPLEATVSADDGSFVLSSLSPGSYRLEAKAEGFSTGFLPGAIVSPESAGHVFRIVVAPGLELSGTVLTTEGEPVEGALVTTLRIGQQSFQDFDFQPVQVTTDKQGAFHYANLRPGEAGLMVSAEHYPLTIVDRVDIGGGAPVNVVLGGSAAIEGTVKDAEGEPLEGAEVMLAVGRRGGAFGRTLSDVKGHYRMENLPSGKVQFASVRKAGYPSWPSQANMFSMRRGLGELKDGQTLSKDFTLARGAVITGVVTDSSTGRPVAGAEVTLRSVGGMFGFSGGSSAITTEDGAYRLEGAGEGMHLLTVVASGFAQAGMSPESMQTLFQPAMRGTGPDPDGPTVQITADQTEIRKNFALVPGATIRGTVVDNQNNPVGGAKVTIGGGDEMGMFSRMMGLSPSSVLTNADGEFQIDGAAPGEKVQLAAMAEGFVAGESDELIVSSGAEVAGVVIRLGTGGTLTGVVLGSDGAPLAGATVRVISWSPNQGNQDWVPTWQLQRAEGKLTDESGAFTVDGLDPGPILVGIDAPGHQMLIERDLAVVEGQTSGGHSFGLERGLEISGMIVDEAGTPVAASRIRVSRQSESSRPVVVGPDNNRTSSGPDGIFSVDRLPAGTYNIRVTADGYASEALEDVAAGSTGVRITMKKGMKIAGIVLLPDGSPAGNIWINVRNEDNQSQSDQTDDAGKFEVEDLRDGTYQVTARVGWGGGLEMGGGMRPNVRETTVTGVAAGTENLQIRLLAGFAIEGFVVDTQGNPIAGLWVSANPRADNGTREGPSGNARVGPDGSFRITGLDDGGYQVMAFGQDYTTKEFLQVRAGATGVRIVMTDKQPEVEDTVIPIPQPR